MVQVGITGGIGSGKTTVCRLFEVLGVPVYYADDRAKELMVTDPELRQGIVELLGDQAYTADGALDRGWIAGQVFGDEQKLEALNALVHPAVWRDTARWNKQYNDRPYTLREAALLYESGGHKMVDVMLVVTAPRELRIQRVQERDGLSKDDIRARMDRQWPQAEKDKRADYLIVNDGQQSLVRQVWHIHHELLAKATKQVS